MGWTKIPKEHHPIFLAALPSDPRVTPLHMFGGLAATVNGNMFAGLWANSVMVKLAASDQQKARDLGGVPFDPMGNGRVMADSYVLPDDVLGRPGDLKTWIARALDYVATLPPKKRRSKASAKPNARAIKAKATARAPKPSAKAKARATARAKAKRARR